LSRGLQRREEWGHPLQRCSPSLALIVILGSVRHPPLASSSSTLVVIPAKAGIQCFEHSSRPFRIFERIRHVQARVLRSLDPRLRGDDEQSSGRTNGVGDNELSWPPGPSSSPLNRATPHLSSAVSLLQDADLELNLAREAIEYDFEENRPNFSPSGREKTSSFPAEWFPPVFFYGFGEETADTLFDDKFARFTRVGLSTRVGTETISRGTSPARL